MDSETTRIYFIDIDSYSKPDESRTAVKELIIWCLQQSDKGGKVLVTARPYDDEEVLTEK